MIKDKVKKALKIEDVNRIKEENAELRETLDSLVQRTNSLQAQINERTELICDYLSRKEEFLSLECLKLDGKPKILVCGFYGARNLGDELMLQSLLAYFDKKNVRVTILLSDNYDFDASVYYPHDVVHYPRRSSDIVAMANHFDVVVWGGGAHLDDLNYGFKNNRTGISYILNMLSKAVIKKGGQVVVLGVSSNKTIDDERYIRDLQFIIDGSSYFALRDTNSLEALRRAGIKTEKVKIIDDLALALLDGHYLSKNNESELVIGLVYILTEENKQKLAKLTKRLADYLKEQHNGKKLVIKMIPFYDYCNNDKRIIERMVGEYLSDEEIEIEDYMDTMDDLVKVLLSCDAVVSMRYHATLVSANIGVKTISLDYSEVHRHYYNKIKYIKEKYCPDLLNLTVGSDTEKIVKEINQELGRKSEIDCVAQIKKISKALGGEIEKALGNLAKNKIQNK